MWEHRDPEKRLRNGSAWPVTGGSRSRIRITVSLTGTALRAYGIARSLGMYYGPVWRRGRMEAFYRQFLAPGDLAFDIGSHVGNRVRAFRRVGARVVAVEPQPDFARLLRLLYGRDTGVVIEECAVWSETRRGA